MPSTGITNRALVWVNAPHFCAGLHLEGGWCCEAAPILRWAIGKPWKQIQRYFANKGYEVEVMPWPQSPNRSNLTRGDAGF